MAGRGRGGARSTSTLTQEQLQALGCVGKDMPNGTTGPPALFPTLPSKPVALEVSTSIKTSPVEFNFKNLSISFSVRSR
jgi:DNA-directed RNA polymerase III subunit RPC7